MNDTKKLWSATGWIWNIEHIGFDLATVRIVLDLRLVFRVDRIDTFI